MAENEDRCGYEHDVSSIPGIESVVCDRPRWDGHDRCVWHARVDEPKPRAALEANLPDPGDRLDGVRLRDVTFRDASWFEGSTLLGCEFDNVSFKGSSFDGTDLRGTRFERTDIRGADFSAANLENVTFANADLRGATFERARIDQVVFSDVRIDGTTEFGSRLVYDRELADIDDGETYTATAQAAIRSYREIQRLFERNGLNAIERQFYLRENDVRRRLAWHTGDYFNAVTSEGSRFVTGYGVSPWRVLGCCLLLILGSALLYPITGGINETVPLPKGETTTHTWRIVDPQEPFLPHATLVLFKSLYFSVITFSTLGYGDIRPVGSVARAIAGAESFLGSLLLALLVFVLTRRIT